ncbi:MAG: hypothetical protein HN686_16740 [Bacteroidetes bacterium]|nr:hypothetical protein [Bacteroidota bacterium]
MEKSAMRPVKLVLTSYCSTRFNGVINGCIDIGTDEGSSSGTFTRLQRA